MLNIKCNLGYKTEQIISPIVIQCFRVLTLYYGESITCSNNPSYAKYQTAINIFYFSIFVSLLNQAYFSWL